MPARFVLSLLPALGIFRFIAGLHGLYLVYLGLPVLMASSRSASSAFRSNRRATRASKHSDLTAIIGDRFMIEVTGDDVTLPLAEHAFESIDTEALVASKR